jgi:UDP-3-O-[3-hydroxymyristoyl] N-acetylglucosamine deacetylase
MPKMEALNMVAPLVRAEVLIVDDEPSIGRALQQVLEDEGIQAAIVVTGEAALAYLSTHKPMLVLLDIWLPGADGLEVLKHIKSQYPEVTVVMMSGHATISTAVQATRLGALDFIEKPLDLSSTIALVKRVMQSSTASCTMLRGVTAEKRANARLLDSDREDKNQIALGHVVEPYVSFEMHGEVVLPQRTIASSTIVYGQGLHSGRKSGLILEPLPPHSGIHFTGLSDPSTVPAHVDYVLSTGFATTLRRRETQISTIEHLMSALHAYGITNLLVKCNDEVPIMDGSAREFCTLLEQTGIEVQSAEYSPLVPQKKIRIGNEREWISIEPADVFSIHYTLIYPEPVGKQTCFFTLRNSEVYKEEIAPARTFGFVRDIGALQKQGLALGGRFDNFVLIGQDGPINDSLRFPDEFVRHKILDAIGDLALLGIPLVGKVEAVMTGHSDNIALLRALSRSLYGDTVKERTERGILAPVR